MHFYGFRFEGVIPPNVSSPVFNIRKPAAKKIILDDYVAAGAMPAFLKDILQMPFLPGKIFWLQAAQAPEKQRWSMPLLMPFQS